MIQVTIEAEKLPQDLVLTGECLLDLNANDVVRLQVADMSDQGQGAALRANS